MNSRFFSLFLQSLPASSPDQLMLFPQRVPRVGFFDELKLVSSDFISARIEGVQQSFRAFVDALVANEDNLLAVYYPETLNLLKASLRLGVVPLKWAEIDVSLAHPRYRLPLIDLMINQAVSLERPVPMQFLVQALEKGQGEDRLFIMNRIIVASVRYDPEFSRTQKEYLTALTAELLQGIDTFRPTDQHSVVALATLCRGLPMAPGFPAERTGEYLQKAIEYLQALVPRNELETLARDENIYTLYLTFSKYHLHQLKDEAGFVSYLQKMMVLDPLDSTSFGELGLHYFKQEKYEKAEGHFQDCVRLGPPSLAMHLYFLGECQEKNGKRSQAISSYEACMQYDPEGLSPVLKLFELKKLSAPMESRQLALTMLKTEVYSDQLTEEEKCVLATFVG
ncbi:MAG TPA: hypothetical protein VNJ01_03170 [Bacteriovoracaceae bacterium]|nr:hypothetical protein [Bacteriovoracaceae bacterium]